MSWTRTQMKADIWDDNSKLPTKKEFLLWKWKHVTCKLDSLKPNMWLLSTSYESSSSRVVDSHFESKDKPIYILTFSICTFGKSICYYFSSRSDSITNRVVHCKGLYQSPALSELEINNCGWLMNAWSPEVAPQVLLLAGI